MTNKQPSARFDVFKAQIEIPQDGKLLQLYHDDKLEEKLDGWLPMGWKISMTGGNATFGYHIEFEIDHLPGEWECRKVAEKLDKANLGTL